MGILAFLLIELLFHLIAAAEWPMRTDYGFLVLGSAGAFCGHVMGWVARVRIYPPQTLVSVPSNVPLPEATVQMRRNCRPLTWLNRGKPFSRPGVDISDSSSLRKPIPSPSR